MLWRVTVALAVMCVGGACDSVGTNVMSRLIMPRDYGVKLCGREFIRAVIFTCGGSRWKRSTEEGADPSHWTAFGDVAAEDEQKTWHPGTDLRDENSPLPFATSFSNSLADLLTLYRATNERPPSSLSFPSQLSSSRASAEQNKDAADLLVTSKKKRNFSLGVAGMCCSQGCTKNDIGRLC